MTHHVLSTLAGSTSPVADVTTTPEQSLTETHTLDYISPITADESGPTSALTRVNRPLGSKHPAFDLNAAEQRASSVQATLESVCVKLAELKPTILELRRDFKRKPKAARIAGCLTWTEFCREQLHRTDRAVQKLLAGKPKPPKPQPELSSGSEDKKGGERELPTQERVPKPATVILDNIEATTETKTQRAELIIGATEQVGYDIDSLSAAEGNVLALDALQFEKVMQSLSDFRKRLTAIENHARTLRATGALSEVGVA